MEMLISTFGTDIIGSIIFLVLYLTVFIIFTNKIALIIYSWGEYCIVPFIKCSFYGLMLVLYIRYILFQYIEPTVKGGWDALYIMPDKYFTLLAILALLIPVKKESNIKLPNPIQIASASFYTFIFSILLCIIAYDSGKNIHIYFGTICLVPFFYEYNGTYFFIDGIV